MVSGGACGGTVVNHKFVVSAAHCFCRGEAPIICNTIKVNGRPTSSPKYNLKQYVKIYLGINTMDINKRDRYKENIYHPKAVTIGTGWVFGDTFSPDIAIIELDRNVEFVQDFIGPLCLSPPGKVVDSSSNKTLTRAFVSGWGVQSSQCDSNSDGPDPFTMCKFPFKYNGQKYTQCSFDPPPSSMNKECQDFFDWASQNKIDPSQPGKMSPSDSYSIYYWDYESKSARETTCYSTQPNRDGWCGTCYNGDLNPGDEGYCDKYGGSTENPSDVEASRPTAESHWGWCSTWCKDGSKSLARTLQETRLDLLSNEECNDLGSPLNSNSTVEICTGRKTSWPKIMRFKKIFNKKTEKVRYLPDGVKINYLGFKKRQKYDFYLGGTDSCQGDSGGPLYLWEKVGSESRAFMIGIVSRGTGCANMNQPGIFTKVSHFMPWVNKIIMSGNCKPGKRSLDEVSDDSLE